MIVVQKNELICSGEVLSINWSSLGSMWEEKILADQLNCKEVCAVEGHCALWIALLIASILCFIWGTLVSSGFIVSLCFLFEGE